MSGQFPLTFRLPYDAGDLSPETGAVLLAQITVHGSTWFSNVLIPTKISGNGPVNVAVRQDGVMR